jgi:hypothetical protein
MARLYNKMSKEYHCSRSLILCCDIVCFFLAHPSFLAILTDQLSSCQHTPPSCVLSRASST